MDEEQRVMAVVLTHNAPEMCIRDSLPGAHLGNRSSTNVFW